MAQPKLKRRNNNRNKNNKIRGSLFQAFNFFFAYILYTFFFFHVYLARALDSFSLSLFLSHSLARSLSLSLSFSSMRPGSDLRSMFVYADLKSVLTIHEFLYILLFTIIRAMGFRMRVNEKEFKCNKASNKYEQFMVIVNFVNCGLIQDSQ